MYVGSRLPLETSLEPTITLTFLPRTLYTQSSFVFSSFIDTKRVGAVGTEGKGEMEKWGMEKWKGQDSERGMEIS